MSAGEYDFKIILKDLVEKSKTELNSHEIDIQFNNLLEKISSDFLESIANNEYSILFDYISESIVTESALRKKYNFEKERKYSQTNLYLLGLLITKVNLIHTKIVSFVVDEIFLIYSDYIELLRHNDFDVIGDLKITVVEFANTFILYLTENRSIDEKIFDRYIKLISQALNIFK